MSEEVRHSHSDGALCLAEAETGQALSGVGPRVLCGIHLRRLEACLHACEGIPTAALEAGIVNQVIKQLVASDGMLEMLGVSAFRKDIQIALRTVGRLP
jgi:hypothetical protein